MNDIFCDREHLTILVEDYSDEVLSESVSWRIRAVWALQYQDLVRRSAWSCCLLSKILYFENSQPLAIPETDSVLYLVSMSSHRPLYKSTRLHTVHTVNNCSPYRPIGVTTAGGDTHGGRFVRALPISTAKCFSPLASLIAVMVELRNFLQQQNEYY